MSMGIMVVQEAIHVAIHSGTSR